MKNYIVRIYRDKKGARHDLVGAVEEVGRQGKLAFTNFEELRDILNPRAASDAERRMAMTEQEKNIKIVKEAFEALNKGEMQVLLDRMADEVAFQSPVTGTVMEPITWARPRRGKAEVAAFFKELFEKVKLIEMKPLVISAHGDRVYVEGETRGMALATGREYMVQGIMAISLRNGKIIMLRHFYDSMDVAKAFKAEVMKAA